MKILVLEGSPNKNGSSNLLAEHFIRGAEEAYFYNKNLEMEEQL